MTTQEIKLAVSPAPIIAGLLVITLAVWGFFIPDRVPRLASLFLLLVGSVPFLQLRKISITPTQITVKFLLTGKTRRIAKTEIQSIYTGALTSMTADTGIVPKPRMMTIRTTAKQTLNISTSHIGQTDFKKLMEFLHANYAEKLY